MLPDGEKVFGFLCKSTLSSSGKLVKASRCLMNSSLQRIRCIIHTWSAPYQPLSFPPTLNNFPNTTLNPDQTNLRSDLRGDAKKKERKGENENEKWKWNQHRMNVLCKGQSMCFAFRYIKKPIGCSKHSYEKVDWPRLVEPTIYGNESEVDFLSRYMTADVASLRQQKCSVNSTSRNKK